jgi:hypothetical protein
MAATARQRQATMSQCVWRTAPGGDGRWSVAPSAHGRRDKVRRMTRKATQARREQGGTRARARVLLAEGLEDPAAFEWSEILVKEVRQRLEDARPQRKKEWPLMRNLSRRARRRPRWHAVGQRSNGANWQSTHRAPSHEAWARRWGKDSDMANTRSALQKWVPKSTA